MEKPNQRVITLSKSKKSLVKILGIAGIVCAMDIAMVEIGQYLNTPIYVAQVNIDGNNKADLKIYTRGDKIYTAIQNRLGGFTFLLPGEEERLKQEAIEKYKSQQKAQSSASNSSI